MVGCEHLRSKGNTLPKFHVSQEAIVYIDICVFMYTIPQPNEPTTRLVQIISLTKFEKLE